MGEGREEVVNCSFRRHGMLPWESLVWDELKLSAGGERRCHPQTKLTQFRVGAKGKDRQRAIEAFHEIAFIGLVEA
jgi:hypothetical protein